MRKISVFESDDKACPAGYRWSNIYRGRIGRPAAPEYMIRYDKGRTETGTTHCDSLTQAALGMVHDSASQECADLVNAAWSCAKACGFDPVRIVGDFDAEE